MLRFNNWVKVTDELPSPYQSVIIYTSDGVIKQSHIATNLVFRGKARKKMWVEEYMRPEVKVTHWMEEPDPPEF